MVRKSAPDLLSVVQDPGLQAVVIVVEKEDDTQVHTIRKVRANDREKHEHPASTKPSRP